ncbi:MAG: HAMP domain-containing protein [Proteobacteria bacterium]|nr:HAMP domain-containing protein [Pseudomonadota bacterium]
MKKLFNSRSLRFKFLAALIVIISLSYILLAVMQVRSTRQATKKRLSEILTSYENLTETIIQSHSKLLVEQKNRIAVDKQLIKTVKCHALVESGKYRCAEKIIPEKIKNIYPGKSADYIFANRPGFKEEFGKLLWLEIEDNGRATVNQFKVVNPDIDKTSFYYKDKAIYRSFSPEFNDSISRPLITETEKVKKSISGISMDKGAPGFFQTIPIFFPKNYIVAEIGIPLSAILRDLQKVTEVDQIGFVYTDRKVYSFLTRNGLDENAQPDLVVESLERGFEIKEKALFFVPVKDYFGNVTGKIVFVKNVDDLLQEESTIVFYLIIVLLITIILLIALISYLFTVFINRPLSQVVTQLNAVATGDLTENLHAKRNDEIGEMVSALNSMTENLRKMMNGVNDTTTRILEVSEKISTDAEELTCSSQVQSSTIDRSSVSINDMNVSINDTADSVSKLASYADEASSSITEIAASIGEVSITAEVLFQVVEEVSSSVTEMASSVRSITDRTSDLSSTAEKTASSAIQIGASTKELDKSIKDTAQLSEATAKDASAGKSAVDETVRAMKAIEETVLSAAEVIGRLGSKSQDISSIIDVINGVVARIDLLSLNAHIIAAQAGENGKGFAVVASQIKDLATRTRSSTDQIESLITSVQVEVAEINEKFDSEVETVKSGVELSNRAGEALEKIISSADSSLEMAAQMSNASNEQLKGSNEIIEAIENMTEKTNGIYRSIEAQDESNLIIAKAAEKMRDAALHVQRASKEQGEGGKIITNSLENIVEMLDHINASSQKEKKLTGSVVGEMKDIKDVTEKNVSKIKEIDNIANELEAEAEALNKELIKFKI